MPYAINSKRNSRKARKVVNVHQNKFSKGYISTIDNSRRPMDSLSDMTNMEIVQDFVARPRPPLVKYGTQPTLDVIGRSIVRYNQSRSIYWAMDDTGTGKIYKQTDGGAYTAIGGTYDDAAWLAGVQSKARLYLYNGIDNLSYVDLETDTISTYTELATPTAPTPVKSGMAGVNSPHFYRVTANNGVGESSASVAGTTTSGKPRNSWIDQTDYMTITWATVVGATSYTVYYGDEAANCFELYTVAGNGTASFVDYGTLAVNTFKLAPEGNSTKGGIFSHMYADSKNSQVFGITSDNYLFYSAPGTGDFSPYNGGGFVGIDVKGDTQLNYVDGFRNGKGDPVITVSARGAAGKGKLYHVTFDSLTIGDQVIVYPNVYEASGQSGTYAPRATIKERDSLYYPTGVDFKSTGTSQNIVNILTTNRIDQGIEPDTDQIDLINLYKAVGLAYKDRLYFALPVASTENNQIWYIDLARKNLWVLRWNIAAKDMWLYEDNQGATHFCVLVNNSILEFSRAGARSHQDDNVAWSSRVAFESMVWDEDGMTLGSIRNQYFKFLSPKGVIDVNATGLTRKGVQTSVGSDTFTVTTTFTGYDMFMYDVDSLTNPPQTHIYDEAAGTINSYGKSVAVLRIKPKGLLNQLDWEVTSNTSGTDYTLSAVNTRGFALDSLVLKTN
jgi:hypothetical protein